MKFEPFCIPTSADTDLTVVATAKTLTKPRFAYRYRGIYYIPLH